MPSVMRVFVANEGRIASCAKKGKTSGVFYGNHRKYAKNNLVMVVVRVRTIDGRVVLVDSSPCEICIKMMKIYGIKKVYYSTADGSIECKKINDIEPYQSKGLKSMLSKDSDFSIRRFLDRH